MRTSSCKLMHAAYLYLLDLDMHFFPRQESLHIFAFFIFDLFLPVRIVQIEQQPKQPQMPVERPPETSRRMVVAVPRRRIPKW